MRILLTNDDGIDAPGLHALREIATELAGPKGEVWVSAPETNQSGAGHSLSLNEPLRMREVAERVYAVRGTPTDSVIMGMRHVLKDRSPDLVLSGINRGANIAEDVTYSGTIAGAFEGTQLGVRSIALSQAYSYEAGDIPHWETPIRHAPKLIRDLLAEAWPAGTLMNINFPDRRPDPIEGLRGDAPGPTRPAAARCRCAARHVGQSLLLARLCQAPLQPRARHRHLGGLQRLDLGDAAQHEPDQRGHARAPRQAIYAVV